MSTLEKIGLALVGAAMFYTAVAPESQTVKLGGTLGKVWTDSLKIVTGQA